MADGTKKPIYDIRPGEYVLARDPARVDGAVAPKRVSRIFVHPNNQVTAINVDGEFIFTTLVHPFYLMGKGWVQVGEMKLGDTIVRSDGSLGTILAVFPMEKAQTVYNLAIEDWHTYFVGESSFWVHNLTVIDDLTDAIGKWLYRGGWYF